MDDKKAKTSSPPADATPVEVDVTYTGDKRYDESAGVVIGKATYTTGAVVRMAAADAQAFREELARDYPNYKFTFKDVAPAAGAKE